MFQQAPGHQEVVVVVMTTPLKATYHRLGC
jgi:hypothetical protein